MTHRKINFHAVCAWVLNNATAISFKNTNTYQAQSSQAFVTSASAVTFVSAAKFSQRLRSTSNPLFLEEQLGLKMASGNWRKYRRKKFLFCRNPCKHLLCK
jgi:hypothetical protein